jgi:hypothetical protein
VTLPTRQEWAEVFHAGARASTPEEDPYEAGAQAVAAEAVQRRTTEIVEWINDFARMNGCFPGPALVARQFGVPAPAEGRARAF